MSVPKLFRKFLAVFSREKVMDVTFFLTGGQQFTLHGITKITVQKGADNRYSAYSIEWATGYKPALFSVALDDISAIIADEA